MISSYAQQQAVDKPAVWLVLIHTTTRKSGQTHITKLIYNIVGVVVAMVISTMHEKSCIDSHKAREFEKSSKIQSFTHLAITMMILREYHSHEFLKLSKLYNTIIQKVVSYKIAQEFLFELSLISLKNYRHIIFKTDSQNHVPFKIFASIICIHLVTPESL